MHDRGDGALMQVAGNVGFSFGTGGFVNLSAEFPDKESTNRSELDRRQQYPLVNGRPDPRESTINRLNHRFGDAETQDRSLFLNAGLPFGDSGTEAYSFASFAQRDGESAGFFRRALDARNIIAIYPNGFLPLINSDVRDSSLAFGVRGTSESGWAWDASVNYGQSNFDFLISDTLYVQLGPTSQKRSRHRQKSAGESHRARTRAPVLARIAESAELAPAVVAKAAAVLRSISAEIDSLSWDVTPRRDSASAFDLLIGNTLQAQGHAAIRKNDPNRLPDFYDPSFIHADADLAHIADGLVASKSGRLCLYGPPGTGKTALADGWPSNWICRCW